jgi:hypothetical protein
VYILSAYPAIALLFGAWWQRLTSESTQPGFLTRLGGYLNAGSFVGLSALLIFQSANQAPLSYLASGLGPKDKTDLAHVAGLLLQHRTIVLMWAGVCALGGIIGIVSVKRAAWERLAWCAGLLMIASLTSVRTLSMDLAREYSFKPFMLKVVGTVKACAFVLLQFRRLFSNVLRRPAYPSLERGSYSALLHPRLAKRVGGH